MNPTIKFAHVILDLELVQQNYKNFKTSIIKP